MIKLDTIIAVQDVTVSAQWYQSVFDCKRTHGGNHFAVLEDAHGEVLICLHQWGAHGHPTMTNSQIIPGNGVILYFKTDNLQMIRKNVEEVNHHLEEDIHLNSNSNKMEFSIRDPDGYYLTITELHQYEG